MNCWLKWYARLAYSNYSLVFFFHHEWFEHIWICLRGPFSIVINVGPSSSIWSMDPLILKINYLFISFNATDCWNRSLSFFLVLKDIQYCTLRLHSQYKIRSTWIPIRFAIRITNSQIRPKNTYNQSHHHLNPKIYLFNNALFESDWNCGGCTHYLHKWNGFQWRTLFVGYVRLVLRILIKINVILSPFVVNFVLN